MNDQSIHFLKISGLVPVNKRKEFEQTLRFMTNQFPAECMEYHISMDIFTTGYYHFYSLWSSGIALTDFLESGDFHFIRGLYKTVGSFEKAITGELLDIKSFK